MKNIIVKRFLLTVFILSVIAFLFCGIIKAGAIAEYNLTGESYEQIFLYEIFSMY